MISSNKFEGAWKADEPLSPRKTVRFADSLGRELTSTHFFANEIPVDPINLESCLEPSRLKGIKVGLENGGCATKILNFRAPRTETELMKEVEQSKVCLEEIVCREGNVWGKIRVSNVDFEKTVTVRYTIDSWQSYKETTANYGYGSITGTTDTFGFHISFPQNNDGREKRMKRLEFAICYKVGEQEFWDNNFGDNYRIVYA